MSEKERLEVGIDEFLQEKKVFIEGQKHLFNKVLNERLNKTEKILTQKAKEYATNEDRFHNFRVAARINNTTPEQALFGMMLKHIVSVLDLIKWSESDPDRITKGLIDEKIGDNINYLILLEGLLRERIV